MKSVLFNILLSPITAAIAGQLIFTAGDLIARANMKSMGFRLSTFLSGWFVFYFCIRQIAMFLQLYVFASVPIGKTMALFGAISILLSNALGILFLGEYLSTGTYIGIVLAVMAFAVLAFVK